jgi:hypothetical protein
MTRNQKDVQYQLTVRLFVRTWGSLVVGQAAIEELCKSME